MTLAIEVFGGLEITLHGKPIKLPLKGQALLAYLACQTRDQSRDTLADLLWPDQPAKTARHSLRNCLLEMRRALGFIAVVGSPAKSFHCRLAADVTSDIAAFRTLAETKDCPSPAILDLYRGQLLHGFDIQSDNFSGWLSDERRRTEASALLTLSRLAVRASAIGAYETAVRAARMAVSIDELDEASHQQMIMVLSAAGRRVEAVRFLRWVREVLHRELGEQPNEKTLALVPDINPTANEIMRSRNEIARLKTEQSASVALLEETLLVKTRNEFVALRSRIRQALIERKPAKAA